MGLEAQLSSMLSELTPTRRRFLRRYVPATALVAALCCLTPVAIVLVGMASVSYAAGLADVLWGQYGWVFQLAGLLFLLGAVGVHLYGHEEVCSLDDAVRKRRLITNFVVIALLLSVLAYALLMFVVEVAGMALGIM